MQTAPEIPFPKTRTLSSSYQYLTKIARNKHKGEIRKTGIFVMFASCEDFEDFIFYLENAFCYILFLLNINDVTLTVVFCVYTQRNTCVHKYIFKYTFLNFP